MKNWKENNLSGVEEYPFDFRRYIEERLREIDDLGERGFAKEVLLTGLGNAIQMTEEKYQALERRIYEELELQGSQFEVVTTVIRREHYDAINQTLFPVLEADLQEQKLSNVLSSDQEIYAGTVFLKITEAELMSWRPERRFVAFWEYQDQVEHVTISVRPAKRYRQEVERLYQMFQDNQIAWETIHVGHLERFFDVYIEMISLPERISKNSSIQILLSELDIQWDDNKTKVEFGMVPLWNIERLSFDSEKFKEATIDGSYYVHDINIKNWVETDGYLIEKNEEILEIRHEPKKIVVKSLHEEFRNWTVFHFTQNKTICSLDYQESLLTNHKRDTFLGRFSAGSGIRLMTKADLFRRIMDLDIRDYIKVVGYEISETLTEIPEMESMNWFIPEGLIPLHHRRFLSLQFDTIQPDHYLTDSMINFVVSELQMELMEYYLVGVRV
ncbi:hypothetical protein [Lacrimispora brassicae]